MLPAILNLRILKSVCYHRKCHIICRNADTQFNLSNSLKDVGITTADFTDQADYEAEWQSMVIITDEFRVFSKHHRYICYPSAVITEVLARPSHFLFWNGSYVNSFLLQDKRIAAVGDSSFHVKQNVILANGECVDRIEDSVDIVVIGQVHAHSLQVVSSHIEEAMSKGIPVWKRESLFDLNYKDDASFREGKLFSGITFFLAEAMKDESLLQKISNHDGHISTENIPFGDEVVLVDDKVSFTLQEVRALKANNCVLLDKAWLLESITERKLLIDLKRHMRSHAEIPYPIPCHTDKFDSFSIKLAVNGLVADNVKQIIRQYGGRFISDHEQLYDLQITPPLIDQVQHNDVTVQFFLKLEQYSRDRNECIYYPFSSFDGQENVFGNVEFHIASGDSLLVSWIQQVIEVMGGFSSLLQLEKTYSAGIVIWDTLGFSLESISVVSSAKIVKVEYLIEILKRQTSCVEIEPFTVKPVQKQEISMELDQNMMNAADWNLAEEECSSKPRKRKRRHETNTDLSSDQSSSGKAMNGSQDENWQSAGFGPKLYKTKVSQDFYSILEAQLVCGLQNLNMELVTPFDFIRRSQQQYDPRVGFFTKFHEPTDEVFMCGISRIMNTVEMNEFPGDVLQILYAIGVVANMRHKKDGCICFCVDGNEEIVSCNLVGPSGKQYAVKLKHSLTELLAGYESHVAALMNPAIVIICQRNDNCKLPFVRRNGVICWTIHDDKEIITHEEPAVKVILHADDTYTIQPTFGPSVSGQGYPGSDQLNGFIEKYDACILKEHGH